VLRTVSIVLLRISKTLITFLFTLALYVKCKIKSIVQALIRCQLSLGSKFTKSIA
jgi:hypothetical protein